jgi:hypothetical protein
MFLLSFREGVMSSEFTSAVNAASSVETRAGGTTRTASYPLPYF